MNTVTLEPARPTEDDARQVMAWRNDPVTRAASFHREEKLWESFWPEYRERFFPADAPGPVFAKSGDERVGFLSFARAEAASPAVEISINLAPERRGQGLGVAALRAAEVWLRAAAVDAIYAEVRAENAASRRTFEAAGYRSLGEAEKSIDTGEQCRIVRYVRELG